MSKSTKPPRKVLLAALDKVFDAYKRRRAARYERIKVEPFEVPPRRPYLGLTRRVIRQIFVPPKSVKLVWADAPLPELICRRTVMAGAAALALLCATSDKSFSWPPRGSGSANVTLQAITNARTLVTYSTIPLALAAAESGDTILLPAGDGPGVGYADWSNNYWLSGGGSHGDAFSNMFLPQPVTLQGVGSANNGKAHLQYPYARLAAEITTMPPTGQDWAVDDVSLFDPLSGSFSVWGENDPQQALMDAGATFFYTGIDTVNNLLLGVTAGYSGTWPASLNAETLLTMQTYGGNGIFTTNTVNPGCVFTNLEINGAITYGSNTSAAIKMGASSTGTSTGLVGIGSITVNDCYIHDSVMGIEGNGMPYGSGIFCHVYGTELYRCGNSGFTHNIYVNSIEEFIFSGSYSHFTMGAHLVKTRARTSTILYSKIAGEQTDTTGTYNPNASCNIDFSNGGACNVIGCQFEMSYCTTNVPINMCAEVGNAAVRAAPCPTQELNVVGCTFLTNAWQSTAHDSPLFTRFAVQILYNLHVGSPEQQAVSTNTAGGSLGQRSYLATATCVAVAGGETTPAVQSTGASLNPPQYLGTSAYVWATLDNGFLLGTTSPVVRTGAAGWNQYLAMQDPLFSNATGNGATPADFNSNIYTYATPITGNVLTNAGSPTVAGIGTAFTTDCTVGQNITINNEVHEIGSIQSDAQLTTTTDWLYTTNSDPSPQGVPLTPSPVTGLSFSPLPVAISLGPVLGSTSGGALAARSYYFGITYTTAWGESINNSLLRVQLIYGSPSHLANNGAAINLAADTLAQVFSPPPCPMATGWNLYAIEIAAPNASNGFGPYNGTKQNTGGPIPIGTNWTEPTTGLLTGGPTLRANWYKQNASPIAIGTGWVEPSTGPVAGANIPTTNTALGSPVGKLYNNLLEYFVNVSGQAYDGVVSNTGYLAESGNLLTNYSTSTDGGPPWHAPVPDFTNESVGDYHLLAGSPAITGAVNPGNSIGGTPLTPVFQFVDPGYGSPPGTPIPALIARPTANSIGAYEYGVGI